MTDSERITRLESQIDALALALSALIAGGVADGAPYPTRPSHLNGAGRARQHLESAELWTVG